MSENIKASSAFTGIFTLIIYIDLLILNGDVGGFKLASPPSVVVFQIFPISYTNQDVLRISRKMMVLLMMGGVMNGKPKIQFQMPQLPLPVLLPHHQNVLN